MGNKFYAFLMIMFLLVGCKSITQEKKSLIKAPLTITKNGVPLICRDNWQHLDIEKDTLAGTSLNKAYKELIKTKKGKKIIVAVIDTDIDINHEDLKGAIWINKKEIPNNGKDDDHNGYIDDVNGWNFLGNRKGEHVIYANNEHLRLVKKLKDKYHNFPKFNGIKLDSLFYIKSLENYKTDKENASLYKQYATENLSQYRESIKQLKKHFNKSDFSLNQIDSLYKKNDKDYTLADNILVMWEDVRLGKDYEALKSDSIKVEDKFRTTFNDDYYDRSIIGDNEFDINDKYYGNNDVSKNAKWTYHGTIVSGILGARRSNKIGIDGFSDSITIMPILAIPTGGYENDKDVALAIRYAVDNGAKIINMSFGKTDSAYPEWVKEAFLYAEQHDVLLVAGAGNDSSNSDINPFYPIDYDINTGKEFCSNFIKVGALSLTGDKYFPIYFTNYGKKTVDVFAPGYFLKTTYPDNKYAYRDGTSMASPIVCGVAALVRSYYPKLSASQVKQIILDSGVAFDLQVQVPGEKEDVLKPFSELSKSGKVVNVYNALLLAKEMSKNRK